MQKIHEYALDLLGPVLKSYAVRSSDLTHQDKDVLRAQCEEDLHQFLGDAGAIRERNTNYDSHDE